MMGWILTPLFLISVLEFFLLKSAWKSSAELNQENVVLKITNRRLNDQLRIAARPPAKLDESLARMHEGNL